MYGFIYITTNTVNGKRYIGQSCYHKRNWKSYLGSGVLLKQAVKKYGSEKFSREIIAEGLTKEILTELEQKFLDLYQAATDPSWYNISPTAQMAPPSWLGRRHSQAHKDKMSLLFKGKPRPPHVGLAVALAQTGRPKTSQAIQRHKENHSGAKHFRAKSVTIDGKTYDTITEAVKQTGISYHHVRKLTL